MLDRFLTATPAQARMLVFQETDESVLRALLDMERRDAVREAVSSRLDAMYAGHVEAHSFDVPASLQEEMETSPVPSKASGPTLVPPSTAGPTLVPLEERSGTPKTPKEVSDAEDAEASSKRRDPPPSPVPPSVEDLLAIFPKKIQRKKGHRSDPDVVLSSERSREGPPEGVTAGTALPPPEDLGFEAHLCGPDDVVEALAQEDRWSCRKCHFIGVPDDFGWRNVGGKRYRQPYCRPCRRESSRNSRLRRSKVD